MIHYAWAMCSKWSFQVPVIRQFISRYHDPGEVWLNPFYGKTLIPGTITNDLNPDHHADYHLEAVDFIKQFADVSVDGVLFDPPYSSTQIKRSYAEVGIKASFDLCKSSFYGRVKDEIARVVKPGGTALSFGWNSTGMGKGRRFVKREILLVNHGGNHNDAICVAETKIGLSRRTKRR